jgi:hypothetical protein
MKTESQEDTTNLDSPFDSTGAPMVAPPLLPPFLDLEVQPLPASASNNNNNPTEEPFPGAYANRPGQMGRRLLPALLSDSFRLVPTPTTRRASATPTTNNPEGLVQARPVSDEEGPPLMVAQEETSLGRRKPTTNDDATCSMRRHPCLLCAMMGAGVLAFLVLVLWLAGVLSDGDVATTALPENAHPATAVSPTSYIQKFLPQETRQAVTDPQSAQSEAFQWLEKDPQVLSYSKKRLR